MICFEKAAQLLMLRHHPLMPAGFDPGHAAPTGSARAFAAGERSRPVPTFRTRSPLGGEMPL